MPSWLSPADETVPGSVRVRKGIRQYLPTASLIFLGAALNPVRCVVYAQPERESLVRNLEGVLDG